MRVIVNPHPTLVLHLGKFQASAMRNQRVSEADVRAAVRRDGIARLEDVGAVVLEADGTFSVIKSSVIKSLSDAPSVLADIPELGGSNEENKDK